MTEGSAPRSARSAGHRYTVRAQRVSGPRGAPERVLVAVFPLRGGGAACLQLQDEGGLRRGGVYLLGEDDAEVPGHAPRFEELFTELAAKARQATRRARLERLLRAAHAAARATRPRLDPAALDGLLAVARDAAKVKDSGPGVLRVEALVVACMLIFVSEEERYPRPRFRGGDVALETLLSVVHAAAPGRAGSGLVDSRQSPAAPSLTPGDARKDRGGATPHPRHRRREQAAGPDGHPRRARPRT